MKLAWKITGISAIALFVGGMIAMAMSAGPGKGGNLGAALLGLLLWFLALGAALACAVTFLLAMRQQRAAAKRGFDVVANPHAETNAR